MCGPPFTKSRQISGLCCLSLSALNAKQLPFCCFFFIGNLEPFGIFLAFDNVSSDSVELSWQFNLDHVNTLLTVDPPDIPTSTFSDGETSVQLFKLMPGSIYRVYIFPYVQENMSTSTQLGDPLSVEFETRLGKPNLVVLGSDESSVFGVLDVNGRFDHAHIQGY